jgi:hypothetical protein
MSGAKLTATKTKEIAIIITNDKYDKGEKKEHAILIT